MVQPKFSGVLMLHKILDFFLENLICDARTDSSALIGIHMLGMSFSSENKGVSSQHRIVCGKHL